MIGRRVGFLEVVLFGVVLFGVLGSCGPDREELETQERAIWAIVLDEMKTFDQGGFVLFERSDAPQRSVEMALKLGLVWAPWGEELTTLAREIESGMESLSMAAMSDEYGCGLVSEEEVDEARAVWKRAKDAGADDHEQVSVHREALGARVEIYLSRVAFSDDRALVHCCADGIFISSSGYYLLERSEGAWTIVKRITLEVA